MKLSILMHRAAVAFHAALVVAVVVHERASLFGVLLAAALLLPLPGIVRARGYTYAWASMLVTFYAGGYLAGGYATGGARWPWFLVASIAAADFVSLVMFVRFRARETAAARPARTEA